LGNGQVNWNEANLERQELARFQSRFDATFSRFFRWTALL
jgi:hypothetical protein